MGQGLKSCPVAKLEGFSAAARHLHLSTTAVSRHIMELEHWLGVQLFHRTTRHLSLTDVGQAYLERCIRVVDDVENLEQTSHELNKNPQGKINVTAPVFMGRQFLGPLLPRFFKQYPRVKINLQLLDRYVNLIEEGFDVALRVSRLPDSNLISRKLGDMRMVMVASPSFIKTHGLPESLGELKNFNCIVDSVAEYQERWPLDDKNGHIYIKVNSNLGINNGELVREMALAGIGITLLPDFFVASDIRQGRLVTILKDKVNRQSTISVIYPQSRYLSGSVRVFIDFLVEQSGQLQEVT